MGTRRLARECALQMLYQIEIAGTRFEVARDHYWKEQPQETAIMNFANQLAEGVLGQQALIDTLIEQYSMNWKLTRMVAVDKNILRLAVYELKNCSDIPLKVTLNEAIEIAKKFGTEDSSAFINGVLDKIARELGKE